MYLLFALQQRHKVRDGVCVCVCGTLVVKKGLKWTHPPAKP